MRNAFQAMKRWLENKDKGKTLAAYFSEYPYESVAIYGTDEIAVCAFHEMKEAVAVKYFIDKGAERSGNVENISVVLPSEILTQEKVDAIIVTDFLNYLEILDDLMENDVVLPTVCLKDILFEM